VKRRAAATFSAIRSSFIQLGGCRSFHSLDNSGFLMELRLVFRDIRCLAGASLTGRGIAPHLVFFG
jgi:hypothetical protein